VQFVNTHSKKIADRILNKLMTKMSASTSHHDNKFHVVECGGDVMHVLKRYTNFKALGRGAQGVVL
jgi:hypothetical protein